VKDFEVLPEKPAPDAWAERADQLTTKIVSVWLWTVFFGLNAGLSYSYMGALSEMFSDAFMMRGLRPDGIGQFGVSATGEFLITAIPLVQAIGILLNFASWAFLYVYFSLYLLPSVLVREPAASEERRRRMAATALKRAYLLVIATGIARATPQLILFMLPWVTKIG